MKISNKWKSLNREKQLWVIFLMGCFFLECFFVPRAFKGFNTADEMYMIGTSELVFRGGRILIDDWHPTQQLCAFLIHPLYCLLRRILGSTEGIVMAFRLTALLVHFCIGFLLYGRLKKKDWGAVLAGWLFLTFAPFGIFTLSYNSIEFSVLPLLMACFYSKKKHSRMEYVLYGILVAIIVLANPFALFFYIGFGLLSLAAEIWGKIKRKEIPDPLRLRNFLWMSLGAALLAAVFAGFVLGRGSIAEIRANLPYILSDSEHRQGLKVYIDKTTRYFYLCFKNYKYLILGFAVLYMAMLLDQKRRAHAAVFLCLGFLCTAPYLIYYGFVFQHITVNYQMFPLAFLGLEAFILTRDRDWRLFFSWFLPALLFSMIVQYATNTGIVTISVAYGMNSIIALVFLWDCGKELYRDERRALKRSAAMGFLCLALCLQFAGSLYLRMTYAWGDDRTWRLDTRIERGPLKGVYTTIEGAKFYEEVLTELDTLELTKEDQLLVVGVAPWIYLYVDAGCGSYSTWQVHDGSFQLIDYYVLHPDKFPTVVYMAHWAEDFMNCSLAEMFWEKGYEVINLGDRAAMEAPGRR